MKTRKFVQSAVHHPSVLQPPGAMAAKRPSTYTEWAHHHPSPTGRYLQVPRCASSLSNPSSIRHKRPIAAPLAGESNPKTQVPPRTLFRFPLPQAANLQLVADQFSPPPPFPPMTSMDATTMSRLQGSNHSALLAPVLLVMPSSVAASATFVIPRQLCSATILTGVRQSPSQRQRSGSRHLRLQICALA